MLQDKRRCGLLFLSAMLLIGGLSGFRLVGNVAASPNHRPPAAPHRGELFQSASNCLQAEQKATLSYAGNAWEVELALTIPDVSLVPDDDFIVTWSNEPGDQGLKIQDGNLDIRRLSPIKVSFVFDVDQTALYTGPFLTTNDPIKLEENRGRERDFWDKFCDDLVQQFSFEGGWFTDMGIVYRGDGSNPGTADEWTLYANGVFNALLSAVQQSYVSRSRLGNNIETIMKEDEWPKREGEKIVVIIRWRMEPLTLSSYPPLQKASFKDRTFLLVVDRTSDLPESWENLVNGFKQYGVRLAYIPAPPAYGSVVTNTLSNEIRELQKSIHKSRQSLKLRFKFPYLLDRHTATTGRLQVRYPRNDCSSGEITLAPTIQQQPPPGLPIVIVFGSAITALLSVIQVLFFSAIIVYKISTKAQDFVRYLQQDNGSSKEVA